jgi:alpha-beta hydrolase superfamily lysophospholipase
VPSQNLTVVRLDSASTDRIRWTRPDYSPPADAAYTAEDLAISAPAGHSLGATLTRPKTAAGRLPVAITISGSGLQDRDESLAGVTGYRPFRQIAEALAAKGIATLRFDDRGTGASTGNGAIATSADFADDVRAVIQYLRGRPDIDPSRIVLVGHSEGGLIAPMVAAGDTLLRGIALLAGPAQSGRTIIHYQQRFAAENDTTIRPADREAVLQRARTQLDSIARTNPWMRFFLDHDPLAVAARVPVPVLILQGETDRQVTADQAPALASAFRNARNQNVVVHVLPRVNHLFLEDPSGSPSGYAGLPSKRIPDSILSLLTDWVVQRVR